MDWYIFVGIGVVVLIAIALVVRRKPASEAVVAGDGGGADTDALDRMRPSVADFRVADGAARVHFEVPLGDETDPVLAELLGREAVEVVREKRHQLPIGDVTSVVALGRRDGDWAEAATIALDTPGTLPPPMLPEVFSQAARSDVDFFAQALEMPTSAPGAVDGTVGDELGPIGSELRLPAAVDAGLRAQGIDPSESLAGDIVLGIMRVAGYQISDVDADTYSATRGGQRSLLRVVDHATGDHPELSEQEVRRFVVDFGSAGVERGLLITEKYAPFEIYERERRDPRVRFISRERLQSFVDALSVG